ncbi:unnamed protein product [Discosporangium mesarthrocarpum]
MRPLRWQHLHVPVLHMACAHVLKQAVDAKEPFLIGTYPFVLERCGQSGNPDLLTELCACP